LKGFVGRSFIDKAKKKLECDIISLSRRGKLPQEKDSSVKWLAGDAADLSYVEKTISDYGNRILPFSFDSECCQQRNMHG
jgi:hypothetical protein